MGAILTANVSMLGCCTSVTYQSSNILKSSTGCVEIEIHDMPGHVPCVRLGPSENLKSLLLWLGNESSHPRAYNYLTFKCISSARKKSHKSSIASETRYNWCGGLSKSLELLVNRFFLMIRTSACSCMLTRCRALTQLLHHINNLATNMLAINSCHMRSDQVVHIPSMMFLIFSCAPNLFQESAQRGRNHLQSSHRASRICAFCALWLFAVF